MISSRSITFELNLQLRRITRWLTKVNLGETASLNARKTPSPINFHFEAYKLLLVCTQWGPLRPINELASTLCTTKFQRPKKFVLTFFGDKNSNRRPLKWDGVSPNPDSGTSKQTSHYSCFWVSRNLPESHWACNFSCLPGRLYRHS